MTSKNLGQSLPKKPDNSKPNASSSVKPKVQLIEETKKTSPPGANQANNKPTVAKPTLVSKPTLSSQASKESQQKSTNPTQGKPNGASSSISNNSSGTKLNGTPTKPNASPGKPSQSANKSSAGLNPNKSLNTSLNGKPGKNQDDSNPELCRDNS